ncbi:glycoside hydrolase superfamily [Aspergillus taichungensis]|uniref:glucan endo-1,3-beta-D-glucosidase n=1 Tax=Aspergillus taichungensis TaxID=482145 RepID=A0A2J5I8P1_9EURO|nr:glycoside hydrolase superfamily [Aspergillus taichungensis]
MSGGYRAFSYEQGDDGSGRGHYAGAPPETRHLMEGQGFSAVSEQGQRNLGPSQSMRTNSTATPGMDNLGPAAVGGGIGGVALGVANTHDRQSGIDAMRETDGPMHHMPAEREYHATGADNPYIPMPPDGPYAHSNALRPPRETYGPPAALGAVAGATAAHSMSASNPSQPSLTDSPYQNVGAFNGSPYQRQSAYSSNEYPLVINPDEIVDDGDDGFVSPTSKSAGSKAAAVGGAAGGAAAYDAVPGSGLEANEKGQWVKPKPNGGSRKRGWIVGIILAFVIVGAIVGGAVGGTLGKGRKEEPSGMSASDDSETNGDLDKDSDEIRELMSMPGLAKVFPGMDYTPWGVQYPLCEKYPPSQNNVTRDIAVLSQLTNTVRLYGTDCNQTEMVLHAMERLELKDMKLWLGVWIDDNNKTNDRQISSLYKILDNNKEKTIFKGVIVGNEALYRAGQDINKARKKLIGYMNDVRKRLKEDGFDLPVATSDLGDNWEKDLVEVSDMVMSNVHPFFAGVKVDLAASWTWDFWQSHDVSLTKGTNKKQVISEVGWPSGGGNDCGPGVNCPDDKSGSVAGIDQLNQFMSDWVCQAMDNGTDYFWFEAFDEPWKIQFNTKNEQWEDKWGLMDSSRKLKPGIKIPTCGGKTVD